ncbi:MAG: MFS transporter [Candidatus Parvarchaeum sp.]
MKDLDQKTLSVRYLKGAFLTFFTDMFDIYAPLVFLAPAMEYFLPKSMSPTKLIFYYTLIFGATLVGRPLGAIIFGFLTDTLGRRRITLIVISGFTVIMFLLMLLPGYDVGGDTVIIAFIILRFLVGVFLGGGYTSANPMAIENAPSDKRGLYGGIIASGMAIALLTSSILTLILLSIMSKSNYIAYGWRFGFLLGMLIGILSFVYLEKRVPESILWENSKKEEKTKSGFRGLLHGENLKSLLNVLILSTGMFLGVVSAYGTVSVVYTKILHLSSALTTTITLIAYAVMFGTTIFGSWLSDKIGRRFALVLYGFLIFSIAPLLYYLIVVGLYKNTLLLLLFTTIIFTLAQFPVPVNIVYINERFPTSHRGLGYGIGYSLPVIIAGFYSYYQKVLSNFMPFKFTQIAILSFAGLLWFIGGLIGKETKGKDLN